MTKMLAEGREHACQRLVEEAESKGADAIVAFRFDTSELGGTWTRSARTAPRCARRRRSRRRYAASRSACEREAKYAPPPSALS